MPEEVVCVVRAPRTTVVAMPVRHGFVITGHDDLVMVQLPICWWALVVIHLDALFTGHIS